MVFHGNLLSIDSKSDTLGLQMIPETLTEAVEPNPHGAVLQAKLPSDVLGWFTVIVAAKHNDPILLGEAVEEALQRLPQGHIVRGIGSVGFGETLGQLIDQHGSRTASPLGLSPAEATHRDIAGHLPYVCHEGIGAVRGNGIPDSQVNVVDTLLCILMLSKQIHGDTVAQMLVFSFHPRQSLLRALPEQFHNFSILQNGSVVYTVHVLPPFFEISPIMSHLGMKRLHRTKKKFGRLAGKQTARKVSLRLFRAPEDP
jgi:hypothetical protein